MENIQNNEIMVTNRHNLINRTRIFYGETNEVEAKISLRPALAFAQICLFDGCVYTNISRAT